MATAAKEKHKMTKIGFSDQSTDAHKDIDKFNIVNVVSTDNNVSFNIVDTKGKVHASANDCVLAVKILDMMNDER